MKNHSILNLPNLLSLSRIPLGLLFLFLFLLIEKGNLSPLWNLSLKIISFVVFTVAIITDALDGYYARKLNIVSDFGKHLDPLSDCLFFLIVFFTFMVSGFMYPILFLLIFIRELTMHLILRPYVKSKGKSLPASIFGKLKTIFQCVLSLILLFLLIVQEIFQLMSINTALINKTIHIASPIFFCIITFLSVASLLIYLLNLKKTLSDN